MEYKLNKIDTDIRNTINEQTKEGKIHSKQSVQINNEGLKGSGNRNKEKHKEKKKEAFSISKYVIGKKFVEVKAYKSESIEVDVQKEEDKNKGSGKGLFIDIRR